MREDHNIDVRNAVQRERCERFMQQLNQDKHRDNSL